MRPADLAAALTAPPVRPLLVIAAHPDDEVIGAAGRLLAFEEHAFVVHATDGAPADGSDAARAGFANVEAYGRERHAESVRALRLARVPPSHCWSLGFGDQRAAHALVSLTRTLIATIGDIAPSVILTHAYEGGHPDHDATAFAVANACRLYARAGEAAPPLVEFTSYHQGAGGIETARFLDSRYAEVEMPLTREQFEVKRRMLAAFTTQQRVLAQFPASHSERFRTAAAYDFLRPPHPGTLYYEQFNWGMDGVKWRALARQALDDLG